jgi:hypothetical protein
MRSFQGTDERTEAVANGRMRPEHSPNGSRSESDLVPQLEPNSLGLPARYAEWGG